MPYVEGTAEHLRMTSLFNQGGTYYSNLWCKAIATIIFEEIFKGDPFSRPGGTVEAPNTTSLRSEWYPLNTVQGINY